LKSNCLLDFKGSAADFGYNPYGKVVFGSVHLAEPLSGCQPIITPTFDEKYDNSPIVFVERGNCTFVTKANYA